MVNFLQYTVLLYSICTFMVSFSNNFRDHRMFSEQLLEPHRQLSESRNKILLLVVVRFQKRITGRIFTIYKWFLRSKQNFLFCWCTSQKDNQQ
jgi:hypothetical protein